MHTGLRIGDVLALKTEQLKTVMTIKECKTGKKKRVGLTADLLDEIRDQSGEFWAFPGRFKDRPHTRQAVWKDVKRAAKAFRLPQNIAPHSFRKIYAVDLLNKYGDIKRVQRALNHSNEAITMIYAVSDKLLDQKRCRRKKRVECV
jgi:integrase